MQLFGSLRAILSLFEHHRAYMKITGSLGGKIIFFPLK
jgi:hypothetical protein